MKFKFTLENSNISPFEIEIHRSFWTGGIKVLVNGKKAQRLKETGKPFSIPMQDGSMKKMYVKGAGLDPTPIIFLDDREIILSKRLVPYEIPLAILPFTLVFVGGALGGLLGASAVVINFRIFRAQHSKTVKILSSLGITLGTIIVFLILAVAIEFVSRQKK